MSAVIIEGGIIAGIIIGLLQLFFNIFRIKKKEQVPKTKSELLEKIKELEDKLEKMEDE